MRRPALLTPPSRSAVIVLLGSFFLLVCCSLPASCDLTLNVYSDKACTVPSPLVPPVRSQCVAFPVNQKLTCSQSPQLQQLIPTVGKVQWVSYVCSNNPVIYFSLFTYDYSTPSGGCPTNTSVVGYGEYSNSSIVVSQVYGSSAACSPTMYFLYNSTLGYAQTYYLYGNVSCSNVTSNSAQPMAASAAAATNVISMIIVLLLLTIG